MHKMHLTNCLIIDFINYIFIFKFLQVQEQLQL